MLERTVKSKGAKAREARNPTCNLPPKTTQLVFRALGHAFGSLNLNATATAESRDENITARLETFARVHIHLCCPGEGHS